MQIATILFFSTLLIESNLQASKQLAATLPLSETQSLSQLCEETSSGRALAEGLDMEVRDSEVEAPAKSTADVAAAAAPAATSAPPPRAATPQPAAISHVVPPPVFEAIRGDALQLKAIYTFLYYFAQQVNFDDLEGVIANRGAERHIFRGLDLLDAVLQKNAARSSTDMLIILALEAILILDNIAFLTREGCCDETEYETEYRAVMAALENPDSLPKDKISQGEEILIKLLTATHDGVTYSIRDKRIAVRPTLQVLLTTCYKYLHQAIPTLSFFPRRPKDSDATRIVAAYNRFLNESLALRREYSARGYGESIIKFAVKKIAARIGIGKEATSRWLKVEWKSKRMRETLQERARYRHINVPLLLATEARLEHLITNSSLTPAQLYQEIIRDIDEAFSS